MPKPKSRIRGLIEGTPNSKNGKTLSARGAKLGSKKREDTLQSIRSTVDELHLGVVAVSVALLLTMVEIGRLLLAAKELLLHGEFLPWCRKELPSVGERMCQRYMAVTKFVVEKREELRIGLTISRPELDVESLTEEQVLTHYEVADITRWMAQERRASKQKGKLSASGFPKLSPGIVRAINNLGSDHTIAIADFEIDTDELTYCRRIPCEALVDESLDTIPFAIAIVTKTADIRRVVRLLLGRFSTGTLSEALILLPLNALADELSEDVIELPQVLFREPRAVILSHDNQPMSLPPLTALLVTNRQGRQSEFAASFKNLGSIKVSYYHPF